jgi:hypothetical protein
MMQLISLKSLVFVALLAPFASHANLILNGSFEANNLPKNSWAILNSSKVSGWQGSNIELWHQLYNVQAADGQIHAELNADGGNSGAWSIFQPFATVTGTRYDLSFAYRARASENEAFRVTVADLNQIVNDHKTNSWSLFKTSFVATDSTTTLRFSSLNNGTVGNFLDDVKVLASPVLPAVPESPAWPLLMLAAAGLFWRRCATKRS